MLQLEAYGGVAGGGDGRVVVGKAEEVKEGAGAEENGDGNKVVFGSEVVLWKKMQHLPI